MEGNKLKITLSAARVNSGLFQEQVAEKMGVSRQTVMRWESYASPLSVEQAEKLANIYGLPFENIIFFKE